MISASRHWNPFVRWNFFATGVYHLQSPKANETFYKAAFKLTDTLKNEIHYELSGYNRNQDFSGIRNVLGHS